MGRRGFTLIELLAVIVILSIIALISVPIILGVVEKVKVASYKESLRSIFKATDLYIISTEFNGIPEEGISVTDEDIPLKNNSFISGKIIKNEEGNLELENVSNGEYCGGGTLEDLVVIKGSCSSLDITPPTIAIAPNEVTSNSITISANGEDLESGIQGYQFSKDNGATWTSIQTSNVYTFNSLISNTEYLIKVKVYNNNDLETISDTLTVPTATIPTPAYVVAPTGWSQSKVVTITYPERQPNYIYEYSLDGAVTWIEVVSPAVTRDITFTENGSVIARIIEGTNIISGTTFEVTNIDNIAPILTVNPQEVTIYIGETYTNAGVTAIDNIEGDITSNIIVSGTVDTNTEGTYTLNYNVSDLAGNMANSTRNVNVISSGIASITTGYLNNRSMVLYNDQYYIYWPSGTSIGYLILDSDLQTVSSGTFPINGSTYDVSSLALTTNIGFRWMAIRDSHFYGSHLSAGTSFGWHNAGYMDVANLNGYTIIFHTGRSDANYARVYNYTIGREISTFYMDGGWGESWRVFPYSSNTALALGNYSGKIKITVDSSGNMTYQANPSEIPGDLSNYYSNFGRVQMDENKRFHYMISGSSYKNPYGTVSLNVDAGIINDYVLNIHPNLAVTLTLIDNNKLNYRIINRTNNQIISSKSYTLGTTYNNVIPIQSIGNSNESIFIIRRSDNTQTKVFKIGLPSV